MKKHKLLLALAVSGLVLGACGTEETTSENETEQTGAATEVETTDTAADTSEAVEETAEVSDTVYEGMNGTYEIVETEQLQNAMFPEKQIMAITINYTNTTEEPQNPWFAWASDVEATQETEATVETLMGANGQYPADYKPEA
ncbi:DUF5067 domain-containing protein, partial [Atopococcus tabaci]|uniref:DUF5067 domain-containing protein n=1 Tax=Atopococcus tabaci TaxID=269774 RepID=UPI0024090696